MRRGVRVKRVMAGKGYVGVRAGHRGRLPRGAWRKSVLWQVFVPVLSVQDSSRRPSAGRRGRVMGGQQSVTLFVVGSGFGNGLHTLVTTAAVLCIATLKTEVCGPEWEILL